MAADYYYYHDPATARAFVTPAGYCYQDRDTISAVQQRLLARGYTPTGIIDQPTLTALGIPKAMPATILR